MSQILVDFIKRQWIETSYRDIPQLAKLLDNFVDIDENIAEFVMRANSAPGVSTTFCCAGHFGSPYSAYVVFDRITQDFRNRMDSVPHIHLDSDSPNSTVYRANRINRHSPPVTSFDDLRSLHAELAGAVTDIPNSFSRMETRFIYAKHQSNAPCICNGDGNILDAQLVPYDEFWTYKHGQ